jgi:D-glycero-alpha-D-manno-heptose 1-phosphate guanylyltransferase
MPLTDVIILAGGLGTRLAPTIGDTPKCLAQVAGRPFLDYLLNYLKNSGLVNIILSVGYLHEQIFNHFGSFWYGSTIVYSIEEEPLGTGGALKNALRYCTSENVLVLNGDTLFTVDLLDMYLAQEKTNAEVVMALRHVKDAGRYGAIVKDRKGRILEFREKDTKTGSGLINGGIYLMRRRLIERNPWPEKFSLENDVFATAYKTHNFRGVEYKDYFIDIGIPEDLARAQYEIPLLKNIYVGSR